MLRATPIHRAIISANLLCGPAAGDGSTFYCALPDVHAPAALESEAKTA
jgi:hypothetical protein